MKIFFINFLKNIKSAEANPSSDDEEATELKKQSWMRDKCQECGGELELCQSEMYNVMGEHDSNQKRKIEFFSCKKPCFTSFVASISNLSLDNTSNNDETNPRTSTPILTVEQETLDEISSIFEDEEEYKTVKESISSSYFEEDSKPN